MHPILFSIGSFTVRSYGLMVAIGFALAIYLAWRQAGREGIDREKFLDMTLWVIVAGILGSRFMYVLVSWREFVRDLPGIFMIWRGGLVFYGGFAFALAAVWLYCRRFQLPLWRMFDLCAPYAALGHALGRIGCFLNGCCYGRPGTFCGVVFPGLGDGITRLPTQLFESGLNFLLFFGLLFLRRFRRFAGQLICTYVFAYALGRLGLEFLRGDEIRGVLFFPWLHTSQVIALVAMAAALGTYLVLSHREKQQFSSS